MMHGIGGGPAAANVAHDANSQPPALADNPAHEAEAAVVARNPEIPRGPSGWYGDAVGALFARTVFSFDDRPSDGVTSSQSVKESFELYGGSLLYAMGRDYFVLPNAPDRTDAVSARIAQLGRVAAAVSEAEHLPYALRWIDNAFKGSITAFNREGLRLASAEEKYTALLLGAHFVVRDGGHLYDSVRADADQQGFQARGSSHYSTAQAENPNYGIDLPEVVEGVKMGHFLVGKTDGGDTFFQLESHGVGRFNFRETIAHSIDYLKHIGTGTNFVQIGPQGCIAASEKDEQHFIVTLSTPEQDLPGPQ